MVVTGTLGGRFLTLMTVKLLFHYWTYDAGFSLGMYPIQQRLEFMPLSSVYQKFLTVQ